MRKRVEVTGEEEEIGNRRRGDEEREERKKYFFHTTNIIFSLMVAWWVTLDQARPNISFFFYFSTFILTMNKNSRNKKKYRCEKSSR